MSNVGSDLEVPSETSKTLSDLATLSKCYNFAAIKHRDQRRLDAEKTPYINHPIGSYNTKLIIFILYVIK